MNISNSQMLELYQRMVEIRLFEERVQDLYARGFIPGSVHLYIGQEAIAAGVCAHLRKTSYKESSKKLG